MVTIVAKVDETHSGLWPRELRCYVMRGKKLPKKGERVVIEAPDGEILKVGLHVDWVNPEKREYLVRIW